MGTTVTVVLPAPDAAAAVAVEALFATWETTLSRFRPESELSRLNASAGRAVRVTPLLLLVVEAALRAARATDGIFDPALEPHLRALGYDRTFDDLAPDGPAAPATVPGGSWSSIEIDRAASTVRLPAGAALDLGGIAKGMAVDEAIAVLVRRGVAAAVVEAGGDLAVTGLPPAASAWPVAVEVVNGQREVSIASGALATSGVSRRSWHRGDVEQHHLVDPRTGGSARNDLWSVTAAAATCAQAEVAAKVAFVLGRAEAARFLLRVGISALLVGRDGGEALVGPWAARSAPDAGSKLLVASRGLA
jgi:thiamine biosynthesis lipoprotein